MATANYVPRKVEIKEVVVSPGVVDLSMSVEEAEALMFVLNRVGGNPIKTPRGKIESIHDALVNAGVNASPKGMMTDKVNKAIYFTDDVSDAAYPYGE